MRKTPVTAFVVREITIIIEVEEEISFKNESLILSLANSLPTSQQMNQRLADSLLA